MMRKVIGIFLGVLLITGCQATLVANPVLQGNEVDEVKEAIDILEELTDSEIYELNSYLSELNLSEVTSYDEEPLDHDSLLNLGFMQYILHDKEEIVYELVNDRPYDVFTYDEFNKKVNRYFDVELEKRGTEEWLFIDDAYYHPLLERGYAPDVVTQVECLVDNGDGTFTVSGSVYQFPFELGDDRYDEYLQDKGSWTSDMEYECLGTMSANFAYSKNLEHYVINHYESDYVVTNNVYY